MLRAAAIVFGLLLAACSTAPAAPSASPTPIPSVVAASPSAMASPTPAATTAAPTPSPTPIALPSFADIVAPSGTIVWAFVAASRLFRSTDRGDTWQERSLPPAATNVTFAFADDREGWALVPGSPATQCQAQSVALSHTADGGTTWQRLAAAGIADARCKDTVAFSDAQHGFIGAWDPNTAPAIYVTADGGKTWTASRPLAAPPGLGGGSALRVGRVRAFGSTLLVAASATYATYAYRSTDGGATWMYASTAPNQNEDLAFVTATRWLQISSPGNSKETTDGGATWHAFTTTYQQAAPIAPAIVFGDAQVGYATVRGAIQRTIDGGATWTSIRTPGTF